MNGKRYPLIFLLLFLLIHTGTLSKAQSSWDWHITGGKIIDGSGAPAYRADILIRGDSIGYLGAVDTDTVQTARTADASGKVVTPGYIDLHVHGNPLNTPEFRNFLAMGVTTILLGQDGSSPGDGPVAEWSSEVEKVRPAVNVAALSGHGTIRNKAGAGKHAASRTVLDRMEILLGNDLRAGAFGLSTGLEYVPGLYSDQKELLRMAAVAGKFNTIVMSHLRSEDDSRIEASLRELAGLGKEVKVHVSHLKVVYGEGRERAEEILRYIDSIREEGIDISADAYPYTASYTGIGIVFPEWAKTEKGLKRAMRERPEELKQHLIKTVDRRNGPGAILFGSGDYAGNTLKEVADEKGEPFVQVLLDMGPQGTSAAHFVMGRELQYRIVADTTVMVSSDGSPAMRHPRGYGSFAKIIDDFVIDRRDLSLEVAVRKMSGMPAKTVGFEKRGLIKEGFKADLLVFDPKDIRDRATFEEPHRLAEGFDWIWVNGEIVRENGIFKAEGKGRILKRDGK